MGLNSTFRGGLRLLAITLGILVPAQIVNAEVPLDGSFVAGQKCTSVQSLRKKSKPVRLRAGRTYKIVAANKASASHYLIIVPGASPQRRWAPVGCGKRTAGTASESGKSKAPKAVDQKDPKAGDQKAPKAGDQKKPDPQNTQFVLAASWQPGFCETKPGKVECETQTAERFDASHFSLHGLWPQPGSLSYCKVAATLVDADKAGRWYQLPEITLQPATSEELRKVMPGTQSQLDRHEWIKHGTCYGTSAEEYFGDSLAVMRALNGSAVQQLFASHVGRFLSFDDIVKAFDQSFGAGAGQRVRMQCVRDNGRLIISELTIGLTGDITPQSSLADLLAAAVPTKTECPGGIVDAAGQQ